MDIPSHQTNVLGHDFLYVGEYRFPVLKDKATLHALISNATDFQLFWMINVPCEGSDVELNGEIFHFPKPKVYHESMTFSCRAWTHLTGKHFASTIHDDDPPALYLYEHLDLDQSDLHFVARDGLAFDTDWSFDWAGREGRVRTKVRFTDVTVWLNDVRDEAAAKRRLEQDLDLAHFDAPEVVSHPSAGPRFVFKPLP